MAEEQQTSQERTESPTPRRREQARDEGRVARSQELSAAVALIAGTLVLATVGGAQLANFVTGLFRECARSLSAGPIAAPGALGMLRSVTTGFTLALLPFAVGLMAVATLAGLAQTRGVMSWKPIEPKWSNLNPVTGLKRMIGPEAAFNLLKQVAKLAALGVVTWLVIAQSWPRLLSLADTAPSGTSMALNSIVVRLAVTTGVAFLAVSLADYAFQWFRLEKSLRMSRQDVVHEFRETEGDPMIKGRIRSIARARARRRMFQQVPKADVVIVNPTEIAVALRYDTEVAPAPVVVAMGERKLAERIRELARKAGVPIVENRPVARALLATATIGRPIPPALYTVVAEVLAFVYRRRGALPSGLATPGRTP